MLCLLCLAVPAQAARKQVFHGLAYSGIPDLQARYNFKPLLFKNMNSYAGWSDELALPSSTWYDNLAASYTNANNYLLIDHESWPISTQAERLAAATKFATVYQEIKTRRPELKVGFYGYAPIRDYFRALTLPGHADYLAWQAENNDFAAMWRVVDFVAPTIYFFYDKTTNGAGANADAHSYFVQNLAEAARLRTAYGKSTTEILVYVNPDRHDGARAIDPDVWIDMTQTAYRAADGLILWDGKSTAWSNSFQWFGRFRDVFPFGDTGIFIPRAVRN